MTCVLVTTVRKELVDNEGLCTCVMSTVSPNVEKQVAVMIWYDKLNSLALVRERTIWTKRPPPVGEVSANFCGSRGVTWSAQRIPTAVNLCFLDLEPLLFIQVAPQLTSRDWVDPVPDPLLLRKSGSARNGTRDLCICSQKLWPLDFRGGLLYDMIYLLTFWHRNFTLNFSTPCM
jgi:hypothetical protein